MRMLILIIFVFFFIRCYASVFDEIGNEINNDWKSTVKFQTRKSGFQFQLTYRPHYVDPALINVRRLMPQVGPYGVNYSVDLDSFGQQSMSFFKESFENLFSAETLVLLGICILDGVIQKQSGFSPMSKLNDIATVVNGYQVKTATILNNKMLAANDFVNNKSQNLGAYLSPDARSTDYYDIMTGSKGIENSQLFSANLGVYFESYSANFKQFMLKLFDDSTSLKNGIRNDKGNDYIKLDENSFNNIKLAESYLREYINVYDDIFDDSGISDAWNKSCEKNSIDSFSEIKNVTVRNLASFLLDSVAVEIMKDAGSNHSFLKYSFRDVIVSDSKIFPTKGEFLILFKKRLRYYYLAQYKAQITLAADIILIFHNSNNDKITLRLKTLLNTIPRGTDRYTDEINEVNQQISLYNDSILPVKR